MLLWDFIQRVSNPLTEQQLLIKQFRRGAGAYFSKGEFAISRRCGSSPIYRIAKPIFWQIRIKSVWGVREVDPISLLSLVESRKQVTHRSWHVLSEKGSMMNAAKKMMNLKPRFQVTLRVNLYTYTKAPLHFLHSTWRTWKYTNHTCWFTNWYRE